MDRSYRWSQDELSRERNKARSQLSSHTKDKLEVSTLLLCKCAALISVVVLCQFECEHEQVLAWNRDLKKVLSLA